ncbi:MAG: hypothetical protein K2O04_03210 [Clostridiales bacterium]|nr:hypothetical protein [Clostridiales bacterium]
MKRIKNLIISMLVVLSVGMLGAWTPEYAISAEDRYADIVALSPYATEIIAFDQKETDMKLNSAPQYKALSGMLNACGAVAGSEIVAYYDKYYSNMIPDWQSYFPANGKYRAQDKVYVPSVMNELYSLMRTNVNDVGVSESDFVYGLKQYINSNGYSVGFQNVVNGTSIDYSACKSAIDNNKVIALLSRAVDVYNITENPTQDSINSTTISDLHIMVASGYKEIKYYKGGSLFRTDRYLFVSTGLDGYGTAYYKVNPHSLNYAYVVNIS